jgi:His/Glu/Gln/Arg/opine family amino acid ABC transporter permease subunit
MTPTTQLFLNGTLLTIWLAVMGIGIGMVFGFLAGIATCRRIYFRGVREFISLYFFVVQGTPLYVQILLIYFTLPALWGGQISPVAAGLLAIGMNSIAYVGQIIRGGINAISKGQWEAAYVLGYSNVGTLWHIIIPQVVRNVLPSLVNEMISLIKETSILGVIGVLELTKVARDTVTRTSEPLFWYLCVAAIYLIITSSLGLVARYVERKLDYDHGH